MMGYLIPLVCLLLLLLPGTQGARPSHRAPVIFVVSSDASSATGGGRGTSIRTDGEWRFPNVNADTDSRIRGIFPMATVLGVDTDDEAGNHANIAEWMRRECLEVQKRTPDDCFVISSMSYPPFKSGLDPYDFRRWESSMKRVVRWSVPDPVSPLGSSRPTFRLTPSPTVPDACESRRSVLDCESSSECKWYGVFHGCREGVFCDFQTKFACEHQPGCAMVRNRCRRKD